jgi:hypothetical protein
MAINRSKARRHLAIGAAFGVAAALLATPVLATHSWGGYHWKRTTNAELAIPVGDNVNATWQSAFDTAMADWNASAVIQSPVVAGTVNPRTCKAQLGTIQVCNASYGKTGWLGIASISLSGGHISQGTTKLNDTYFNTAQYNTPAWRALVTCQEIGHDYGLDHQDEAFDNANLNTCMDYTNLPASNQHPNAHDYSMLVDIYGHLDAAAALPSGPGNSAAADIGDTPASWGRAVHRDGQGRPDVFERQDGPGRKTITHVFWAIGEGPGSSQ